MKYIDKSNDGSIVDLEVRTKADEIARKPFIIGYARVSTIEQNEARQIESLAAAGCEYIYIDKRSGKDLNRPKYQEMLRHLSPNDTVIVSEYSRLGRSTIDLLNTIQAMNEKGVVIKSLKEDFDTSSIQGRLIIKIFASIAEFERELILQRQKEGIAIAKAEGKYTGRKAIDKPSNWDDLKDAYTTRKLTATAICKELCISRNTFYRWLKEEGAEE